ncbi:MAG: hypothetical protein IPM54_21330 [Polyangiaceae bacterium]|nr:hypothetical protein [Polyangiaceae bacterium]
MSYPIMVAPRDLLTTFNGMIRALESRVEVLVSENITLAALRDTLLPRLLSGELSVAQAEAFAEGNGYSSTRPDSG